MRGGRQISLFSCVDSTLYVHEKNQWDLSRPIVHIIAALVSWARHEMMSCQCFLSHSMIYSVGSQRAVNVQKRFIVVYWVRLSNFVYFDASSCAQRPREVPHFLINCSKAIRYESPKSSSLSGTLVLLLATRTTCKLALFSVCFRSVEPHKTQTDLCSCWKNNRGCRTF